MDARDRKNAQRLLAHLETTTTRWFKVSAALLDWGRKDVPETRDSYNPVKRLVATVGLWMDTAQTKRTNRKFDREWEAR